MRQFDIIGAGMGTRETLTGEAAQALASAEMVFASFTRGFMAVSLAIRIHSSSFSSALSMVSRVCICLKSSLR